MNKKELIIKTWNVSQKTTLDKQTKTPEFIVDEIIKCKDDRADIIVLTEFFKLGNWKKIVEKFEAEKFDVRYNLKEPMEGYNQILIAVKKETIKIIDDMDVMENDYNVMPNYLRLDIEHNNTPLTIIGVRIRKGSNSDKKRLYPILQA